MSSAVFSAELICFSIDETVTSPYEMVEGDDMGELDKVARDIQKRRALENVEISDTRFHLGRRHPQNMRKLVKALAKHCRKIGYFRSAQDIRGIIMSAEPRMTRGYADDVVAFFVNVGIVVEVSTEVSYIDSERSIQIDEATRRRLPIPAAPPALERAQELREYYKVRPRFSRAAPSNVIQSIHRFATVALAVTGEGIDGSAHRPRPRRKTRAERKADRCRLVEAEEQRRAKAAAAIPLPPSAGVPMTEDPVGSWMRREGDRIVWRTNDVLAAYYNALRVVIALGKSERKWAHDRVTAQIAAKLTRNFFPGRPSAASLANSLRNQGVLRKIGTGRRYGIYELIAVEPEIAWITNDPALAHVFDDDDARLLLQGVGEDQLRAEEDEDASEIDGADEECEAEQVPASQPVFECVVSREVPRFTSESIQTLDEGELDALGAEIDRLETRILELRGVHDEERKRRGTEKERRQARLAVLEEQQRLEAELAECAQREEEARIERELREQRLAELKQQLKVAEPV